MDIILAFAESGTLGLGTAFWIFFLVALVFGFLGYAWRDRPYIASVGMGFVLVELFLIGWQVFGFPIGK